MKNLIKFSLILPLLSLILSACGTKIITGSSWEFIQSAGGVSVSDPVFRGGEWFLPVNFNVSGTKKITTQPTQQHPKLVCEKTYAKVAKGQIEISFKFLKTKEPGSLTAQCPTAYIGLIVDGTYPVVYVDENKNQTRIREVVIQL